MEMMKIKVELRGGVWIKVLKVLSWCSCGREEERRERCLRGPQREAATLVLRGAELLNSPPVVKSLAGPGSNVSQLFSVTQYNWGCVKRCVCVSLLVCVCVSV